MKGEEKGIINGYGEINFSSWQDAFAFLHESMLDYRAYIWRGQRCDNWKLESRLGRLAKEAKTVGTIGPDVGDHLKQFQFAARGRRGPNPPFLKTDNDWWALGQHHGLATPLLDWTESPYVAVYFAFIGTGEEQTDFRAVYALHKPSVEIKADELLAEKQKKWLQDKEDIDSGKKKVANMLALPYGIMPKGREVEFVRPLSDENQRLVNQAGLFTRFPFNSDVQSWVEKNFVGNSEYMVMKMLIPDKDRKPCLKALNRMNINHLTLFPDLYGASKFCNMYHEIKGY